MKYTKTNLKDTGVILVLGRGSFINENTTSRPINIFLYYYYFFFNHSEHLRKTVVHDVHGRRAVTATAIPVVVFTVKIR